ncbi:MAG: hypothetical protein QM757_46090 [Paludibaculum sp.]
MAELTEALQRAAADPEIAVKTDLQPLLQKLPDEVRDEWPPGWIPPVHAIEVCWKKWNRVLLCGSLPGREACHERSSR